MPKAPKAAAPPPEEEDDFDDPSDEEEVRIYLDFGLRRATSSSARRLSLVKLVQSPRLTPWRTRRRRSSLMMQSHTYAGCTTMAWSI